MITALLTFPWWASHADPPPAPEPSKISPCMVRYYPTHDKMELSWDLTALEGTPLETLVIEAHFVDRAKNDIAFSQGWKDLKAYTAEISFSASPLPAGVYVLVMLVGSNRKELGRSMLLFEKRPPPEWAGNTLGLGDKIPPPFKPVEIDGTRGVAGRKIRVLGRIYDFGRSSLPDQIYIGDEPVLAGPITLLVDRPNGRVRDLARDLMWGKGAGNPIEGRFDTLRRDRVEWESSASVGNRIKPAISGWAEYDGFLWFQVDVRGKEWNSITSLRLEIPISKKWSTLVNLFDPSLSGAGAMPAERFSRGTQPLWVGNEQGGLQWLTESSAAWRLNEPDSAIRVIPRETDTLVQVNFVDHPSDLPYGFHAEFGLIATPVRPEGHWSLTRGNLCGPGWNPRGFQPSPLLPWPGASDPVILTECGETAEGGGANERDRVPSVALTICHVGDAPAGPKTLETMNNYFCEWAAASSEVWKPGLQRLVCSPASRTWQDFLVWTCWKNYELHPFTGLYYASSLPVFSDNPHAGGGVYAGDKISPRWTLLGTRDMARRLYAMLRLKEPEGSIRCRVSGQLCAPLLAFCEMVVDGETLAPRLTLEKPHLFQHLSLDSFRAQYLGSNFGPACSWIPPHRQAFHGLIDSGKKPEEIFDSPDREARWIAGMALAHQVSLATQRLPGDWSSILRAVEAYGLNSREYAFIGYWADAPARLEPSKKDLVVSVYRERVGPESNTRPGRALLVLLNNTEWEGEARVAVDWAVLQADPAKCVVENPAWGAPARVDGQAILLPMTRRDVRLIGIRPESPSSPAN